MAKNFSLNQCALLPAEVNPVIEDEFPMLAGVQSIDYYESILSPSISVQVKILDVDGNLSAKGVYGGEKLAIKSFDTNCRVAVCCFTPEVISFIEFNINS